MAFNFPNTPTVGQIVTGPGGIQYQWDGVKWTVITGVSPGFAPINSPVLTGVPAAPTAPYGTNTTQLATTAFTQAAVAPALNDTGRNYLDNALFRIQQRGAGAWSTSGLYTADRFQLGVNLDTDSVTIVNLTDAQRSAIGDEAAEYGLNNTFIGNSGAAAQSIIMQKIERVRRLSGKTVTISFWAGSPQSLRFGVSLNQFFGTGGSPSPAVNLNGQSVQLTPTATRYSLTFNLPSVAGMTLGTNGDDNTQVLWWYNAGSSNAALSGNVGVQNGSIMMWGVQLEVGSVASPLEKLPYQLDLVRCQRFFYPTQIYGVGYQTVPVPITITQAIPTMRPTPTVTITANNSGNFGTITSNVTQNGVWASGTTAAAGAWSMNINVNLSADL